MAVNSNTKPLEKPDALEKLADALKYLSIEADSFGNVTIQHKQTGSQLVFTTQGDIQVYSSRDVDAKTGRWFHINSDIEKITQQQNNVLYGPTGKVLKILDN